MHDLGAFRVRIRSSRKRRIVRLQTRRFCLCRGDGALQLSNIQRAVCAACRLKGFAGDGHDVLSAKNGFTPCRGTHGVSTAGVAATRALCARSGED